MRTYAPAGTEAVLAGLLEEPSLARGVVHHRHIPAKPADYGPWPAWLHPGLRAGLEARGIERLYAHQAEAVEAVHAGEDITVVTPTASGKTLCYSRRSRTTRSRGRCSSSPRKPSARTRSRSSRS
jgi:ATP-dependent helicase YprA (DUF1998 family)